MTILCGTALPMTSSILTPDAAPLTLFREISNIFRETPEPAPRHGRKPIPTLMRNLLFSFLALLLPLHAGVTAGTSDSSANASVTAGIGLLGDTKESSAEGAASVSLGGSISIIEAGTGDDYLDVSVSIAANHAHSVFNPNDGYLNVVGGGSTHLSVDTAEGFWSVSEAFTPTVNIISLFPGNQGIHNFVVTGDPIFAALTGNIAGTNTSDVTIALQINQGPDLGWQNLLVAPNAQPSFTLEATLEPGEYRILSSIGLTAGFPAPAAESASATYNYVIEVGDAPTEPYVPTPGEHTHPRVGTFLTNSPKLAIHNPTILNEVDQGDGTTAVTIRTQLANSSDCPWNFVKVTIPESFPGGPDVAIINGSGSLNNDALDFNEIAGNATEGPEDSADFVTAIVPNDGLATFRASILDGSRFETYGQELWVFIYPVNLVDKGDARRLEDFLFSPSAPTPGSTSETLIFEPDIHPGLQTGQYYIEHEAYSKIPPISTPLSGGILEPVSGGALRQGFDRWLPFLVTSVNLRNGYYHVGIQRLSFLEVVKHGTIRSIIEPLENAGGLLTTEGTTGDIFPKAQPIHFNRINIADAIDLSGSFLFDPGPIGVEFEMNNLELETFLVTANFRADATLLVETKNAADNTGEPLASQQEQLFNFPLFSVVLPAGITFTPEFSMHVGAAVNAPTGLSVPIQSSMEIDITAGMKNGQPYYATQHTATPPNISTPAIHQQLQASVEAWVAAQLLCKVSAPLGAIAGGPTLGARVGGEFTFAPLADPWWTLQGQLEFLGGVELELAGLVTVIDEEKVIGTPVDLFTFEADGPLFPPVSLRSLNLPDNPGIRPVGGKETRWARALRTTSATSPGTTDHFIHPLTDSADLIAGSGTDISRYGPDGELKWTLAAGPNTRRSVPNPDGGFTVLGDHFEKNLSRFDGDGNRLWSVIHRPASGGLFLNDLVVREVGGEPEYFAVGWGGTTLNDNKPAILKFDKDGTLLWSKAYLPAPAGGEITATEIQRGLVTSDGHLVIIGMTGADIASGQTGANLVNVSRNGFVMKVDGHTGAVLWTTLLAIAPTAHLTSLAESPDGSLYVGGSVVPSILQPVPSLLIAKLAADGTLVDSVLIGSIFSASAQPTGYTSSPVPHTGANVFDRIHAMLWADGALWIGGNIGAPGSSIVTDGQSAFTARLTPDLGVTRFAIHAGASADFIGALAHGGDGLLACGWTKSFLPWPAGAANENAPTPVARLIMKLPWEGLLRFHDLSNGKQPAADDPAPVRGSHYVYPRIIAASDTTLFSARFPSSGDLPDTLVPASDLPMIVSDLALIDGFFPPNAPPKITPLAHHQIEFVPEEIVEDFASYTNYHQIDPDEDSDNDGLDLATEFYHGTDPFVSNSITLQMTTHPLTGAPTLSFPRSPLASAEGWDAPLESSPDLEDWNGVPASSLDAFPNSSGELLYLHPFIIPGEPRQFYRLAPAAAP